MRIKYYQNWDSSVSLVSKVEGGVAGSAWFSHLPSSLCRIHRPDESPRKLGYHSELLSWQAFLQNSCCFLDF